jgi:N-sulfoglucosamine sulfohydrolase
MMHAILRRLLLSALLVSGPWAGACRAETPPKPNIVFAFADDYGRYASAYAKHDARPGVNGLIQTPSIDAIAAAGVLFLNAHVSSPSCTPCRSALLSGRHFWQTGQGAILSGATWDAEIPSYPLVLREAGYHIGKSHKVWSPGTPADAPYGGQEHAYEASGRQFNAFSQNVGKAVEAGTPLADAKAELLKEVRGNFESFLNAREKGRPFCYWFGPTNTHRSWLRGSGKSQWGIEPDSLKGRMPAFLPDVPEIREDFADYLGECLAFDAAIGVLVEQLKERGEWENTLIVVSGDHGAPGFPRGKCHLYDFGTNVPLVIAGPGIAGGRVVEDFTGLPDLAPTFLEAAGVEPPPGMSARSLLPLLKSGRSGQVEPERSFVVTGRERHVDFARAGKLPYPQRAIRTRDHLYIINFEPERYPNGDYYPPDRPGKDPTAQQVLNDTRSTFADMDAGPTKSWLFARLDDPRWKTETDFAFGKRPAEELYLIAEDPDQVTNVAGHPAHAEVKNKLRAQLLELLESTGDPRVTGDRMTFERPPFAGRR